MKRRGVLSEEGSSTVETAVACTVLMAMLFGSTSEMVISQ
jgi:Flp pilus assembly protein TadG